MYFCSKIFEMTMPVSNVRVPKSRFRYRKICECLFRKCACVRTRLTVTVFFNQKVLSLRLLLEGFKRQWLPPECQCWSLFSISKRCKCRGSVGHWLQEWMSLVCLSPSGIKALELNIVESDTLWSATLHRILPWYLTLIYIKINEFINKNK